MLDFTSGKERVSFLEYTMMQGQGLEEAFRKWEVLLWKLPSIRIMAGRKGRL